MNKRPFNLLPLPLPAEYDPAEENPSYFYDNFASAFIEDMIKMMDTGLNIDNKAVEDLRRTIDNVLKDVHKKINRNSIIKKYQETRAKKLQKKHAEKVTASVREVSHYLKVFNEKDVIHRTWVVNAFLKTQNKHNEVKAKWTLKDVKVLNSFLSAPFLQRLLDRQDITASKFTLQGMKDLAEYKLELWNRPRYDSAAQAVTVPDFNPGSAVQKQELFEMLKVEPLSLSKKTGNASWGREQLEELQTMTTDDELHKLLQVFIDFSYSDIIKNNFLKAFDSFTIDGVLHGNVKLFGAKSFRLTSNSPNLLNAPSTGSIYAKPLKRCFKASEGRVIYTADLSALEDRVMANLSKDVNKLSIFTDNIDGHSLATLAYNFPELPELSKLFADIHDSSKGKYYKNTDSEGKVTFSREVD